MTSRRLAGLLGLCLPLAGGLNPDRWIPGYPGQLTVIRLVTVLVLVWIVVHPSPTPLPRQASRLLQVFALVLAYGAVSVLWAIDTLYALDEFVGIALAAATAGAAVLLVGADRQGLRALAGGLLVGGALNVVVALVEVATGAHLTYRFGAELVTVHGLSRVEDIVGRAAWGSMGNPNDLGGLWLLCTAVLLAAPAYGLVLRGWARLLGWMLLGISVVVGVTWLADARAFRIGLAILVAMLLADVLLPPGRAALRVPIMLLSSAGATAAALSFQGSLVAEMAQPGTSVGVRLRLISEGLNQVYASGGFGRGLGTEQALIASGAIPLNFHNVVIQLAAELGLVIAAGFLIFLLVLLASWAFATRSARAVGPRAAFARAALAVALLVYGSTSSGVLESPLYWTCVALTVLVGHVGPVPRPAGRWTAGPDVRGRPVPWSAAAR